MRAPVDTTNWTDSSGLTNFLIDTYSINTCEWPNGSHTIFATAEALSAPGGGPIGAPPVLTGHAVSPLLSLVFSNLITRIAFSEPFFDPALAQTQQVTATFGANVNWTLTIRDIYSNAVRSVAGNGASMAFNWDGNGDGGTNLPPGAYYYYLSAQTNGQPIPPDVPPVGGAGIAPEPTQSTPTSDTSAPLATFPNSARQAIAAGLDYYYLTPPPMPPIFTNGTWVPWELVYGAPQPIRVDISDPIRQNLLRSLLASGPSASAQPAFGSPGPQDPTPDTYYGPSSEAAPAAPSRPPTAPKDGTPGTFGLAFQTYTANGTNGFTPPLPLATFPPLYLHVQMEGLGGPPNFQPLRNGDSEAIYFGGQLQEAAWSSGYARGDDDLKIDDLRGSNTPFNQVDIGFLLLHCVYGTTLDLYAAGCLQMYFPIASGTSATYLRMSEMSFGGDGTNGLKWMALAACTTLHQPNWASMQTQHIYPYTSGLHLLLGVDTDNFTDRFLGRNWASFMLGTPTATPPIAPMKIRDAWYASARKAYTDTHVPYSTNPINFAVAGDSACFNDYLQTKTNTVLSGTWIIDPPTQVYPP
jgi:hypothetical protein